MQLIKLCERAAAGDVDARRLAGELESALMVMSTFDEGPDLVLCYKYLLVLDGEAEYNLHFNAADQLSPSRKHFVESQYDLFKKWWTGKEA